MTHRARPTDSGSQDAAPERLDDGEDDARTLMPGDRLRPDREEVIQLLCESGERRLAGITELAAARVERPHQ